MAHDARWRCTPFRPSALVLDHAGLAPMPDDLAPLAELFQSARAATEPGARLLSAFALLHAAQERAVVVSPYFVPDESLLLAMRSAAERGLDVQLFVSERGDQALVHHAQRSYYEFLLRAGVRIYRYPSPAVLHSKHLSVDDDVAVVGSSNLDIRSFTLNLESSLLIQSRSFVDRLRLVEDEYRSLSRELVLEDWLQRPRRERVVDNLARLTSALM